MNGLQSIRPSWFPNWEHVLPCSHRALPVKVVGRSILADFCASHGDARASIQSWLAEVEASEWTHPQQIKARCAAASFLSENRVIFNLKGNRYRLEVAVAYRSATVIVEWVGAHAKYDARNRGR